MSGAWHCQRDDSALFVFREDEHPGLILSGQSGHPTELAAWEHGLSCLEIQRDQLRSAIKEARREVRRLRRKAK